MTVWITPHLVSAVLAVGGELPEAPRLSELATLNLAAQPIEGQPADTRDEAIPSITDGKPFGSGDSWRWHVHGGFGMEFDDTDNQLFLMGGGLTYFMIQDLALVLETNLIYVDQFGSDAFAWNFNLLARWHFYNKERWSLYVDGGAGTLIATDEVPGPTLAEPLGGSRFNFTPQAGVGFSYEVATNTRMLVGVRWHHISNARTYENNPGRDSFLVYAGVSVPF
jgi:opacity protein-like surface antigen